MTILKFELMEDEAKLIAQLLYEVAMPLKVSLPLVQKMEQQVKEQMAALTVAPVTPEETPA